VFVDSHCHLNYLDDPAQALARARARNVDGCLCIGVEQGCIDEVLALASDNEGVWASVGEHPGSCTGDASWVRGFVGHESVVAIGETGLDYHYVGDAAQRELQRRTFAQQLAVADEFGLPVIVHTRAAEQDTLALIAEFPGVRGVLHCFTESWEMAERALEFGYFISISGIVTFKNGGNVREVARRVPLERLLIETDAPWLAPVPNRGKQNEPAFVVDTAEYLADLRELAVSVVADTTRSNFFRLFKRAG